MRLLTKKHDNCSKTLHSTTHKKVHRYGSLVSHSQGRTKSSVNVQVFEQFESFASERWLKDVAERTLTSVGESSSESLSIVIADDETVRELNKHHRGLDENTDVLSFSFSHQGKYHGDDVPKTEWSEGLIFAMPPGESVGLGEVIISYSQMERQAKESGHPVAQVLACLVIHGILHLLGHDHVEPGEESLMKAQESRVLALVFENE